MDDLFGKNFFWALWGPQHFHAPNPEARRICAFSNSRQQF
jgi:hypothetical protein